MRESQIALEAERDRAVAEVERLQTVATEAQTEAEERSRLLAEEQDRHEAERQTLLTQRTILEQELGSAIEQLAAAAAAADERERSCSSVRSACSMRSWWFAASRPSSARESADLPPEPVADETADGETEAEPEVAAPVESELETAPEAAEVDYSLFVPGPNGYELLPQTGVPPQAGQIVELVLPDRDEPIVYEVARSGRTLPGGDVCVYLAQV